jgi:hypothetical protein
MSEAGKSLQHSPSFTDWGGVLIAVQHRNHGRLRDVDYEAGDNSKLQSSAAGVMAYILIELVLSQLLSGVFLQLGQGEGDIRSRF